VVVWFALKTNVDSRAAVSARMDDEAADAAASIKDKKGKRFKQGGGRSLEEVQQMQQLQLQAEVRTHVRMHARTHARTHAADAAAAAAS
jgi:hypothetical protein